MLHKLFKKHEAFLLQVKYTDFYLLDLGSVKVTKYFLRIFIVFILAETCNIKHLRVVINGNFVVIR